MNTDTSETIYTPGLVSQMLTCLVGPDPRGGPDRDAAAQALGVSQRTVQRWVAAAGPEGAARISAANLRALLHACALPSIMTSSEESMAHLVSTAEDLALTSRGRQALRRRYGARGWLGPHEVIVSADRSLPLLRISVVRVGTPTHLKATAGQDLVVWEGATMTTTAAPSPARGARAIAPQTPPAQSAAVRGSDAIATETWTERVMCATKFEAERLRLAMLDHVAPYRVHTPLIAALPHNASVWLIGAPRPRLLEV